jgi:hypothetical protein
MEVEEGSAMQSIWEKTKIEKVIYFSAHTAVFSE